MILDKTTIRERLYNGEVFKDGTWVEESIKEASYALRVASDGLLLRGKRYKPNEGSIEGRIEIKPGEIAILSTIERWICRVIWLASLEFGSIMLLKV